MPETQYLDTRLSCTWDASLLAPLAELNAEILEALGANAARTPGAAGGASLQWRWQALGAAARQRLAHCPYLLLDAGFASSGRWIGLPRVGVHEAGALRTPAEGSAPFTAPLIRRVLHFAWHLTRSNVPGARVALGMSAECVAVIAASRLVDLEALAEQRPAWIRLRWADQPGLWLAWLAAAAVESPRCLERLQLWGLQSLAAGVLARQPRDAPTVARYADTP